MAMLCPQCNTTHEQRLNCPSCGARLLYHPSAARSDGAWQDTPWGRLAVGLLLAQGLYHGLRQLCTAGLLALSTEAKAGDVYATLSGLVLLQGLQAIGVLAAGILIGAGKRHGFAYGAVVGVWNGILFLFLDSWLGERGLMQRWFGGADAQPTIPSMLGQPMLQAAVGAMGGLIGSLIWKPLPEPVSPSLMDFKLPPLPKAEDRPALAGPVAWGRVLSGSAVAIGGIVWANTILEAVVEASEGTLTLQSHLQTQLVTWEICGLAMLFGSALAGATTLNGMKQGLWVGLLTGTVLFGIRLTSAMLPHNLMLFALLSAIPLGMLGGWFGGQLFPPRRPRFRIDDI